MSTLNGSRHWIITQPAQQIFLKAECHFMQFTSETDLQRLDISGITHNAMSDSDICNLMISDAELELDSHVCKDVFHGIVSVYINVLSFSCQGYYSVIIDCGKGNPSKGISQRNQ